MMCTDWETHSSKAQILLAFLQTENHSPNLYLTLLVSLYLLFLLCVCLPPGLNSTLAKQRLIYRQGGRIIGRLSCTIKANDGLFTQLTRHEKNIILKTKRIVYLRKMYNSYFSRWIYSILQVRVNEMYTFFILVK